MNLNNSKMTALYKEHVKLNAKIVPFAGYLMPINYSEGIKHEYNSVREDVGIFDVSHMGEINVQGKDSTIFLQYITVNDVSKLEDGDAQYNVICNKEGGILDDIIIFRMNEREYVLIVNASNCTKILDWIKLINKFETNIQDQTDIFSLIAIQGKNSREILSMIIKNKIDLKFYKHKKYLYKGNELIVSRTGYTGELGYEILADHALIKDLWNKMIQLGVTPCGLATRDILRLEMKYCLYGNDIDETSSPLEAGLDWVVKLDKNDFIGKKELIKQKEEGISKKLIAFKMTDKCIPRKDYLIFDENSSIGIVTSGTYSIGLEYGIGMGYIKTIHKEKIIYIEIREKKYKAEIIKPPFINNFTLHN